MPPAVKCEEGTVMITYYAHSLCKQPAALITLMENNQGTPGTPRPGTLSHPSLEDHPSKLKCVGGVDIKSKEAPPPAGACSCRFPRCDVVTGDPM